jgi:formamidopyrimidine-DNA glycosylase
MASQVYQGLPSTVRILTNDTYSLKFVLRLVPVDATEASSSANSLTAVGDSPSPTEIAFLDPRRLARIRLCSSPLTEAPISELGFDPILSMPPLETFAAAVHKRSCPIKALLLDQSFSAGVGNWVAGQSGPLARYDI